MCHKEVSRAGISNQIPQYSVGCDYKSMLYIKLLAVSIKSFLLLISWLVILRAMCHNNMQITIRDSREKNIHWNAVKIKSLWPSDAIWHHKSWSTLIYVMTCCLTGTSLYWNKCCFLTSEVLWTINRECTSSYLVWCVWNYTFKMTPRGNELRCHSRQLS